MPYIPLAQRGRSNNSQQGAINSLEEFKTRIANRESGGNYGAMGPEVTSGMYTGDRAVGKYQVMGLNVPDWTREALGRSMTADEFKNSPEAQEAVATKRFTDIYNKYGNWEDVASVWFTGRPRSEAGGDVADVLGTTNDDYIASVVGGMGDGFNQLGQAAGKYIPMAMRKAKEFYEPSAEGVRPQDFLRELPGAAFNTAKGIAQTAAKAPFRLSQVPEDIVRGVQGQEPTQPFNVPLLGEVKSYARQAVDDTPEMGAFPAGLKAVSEGVLDAAGMGQVAQSGVTAFNKLPTGPTPKGMVAFPDMSAKVPYSQMDDIAKKQFFDDVVNAHINTAKQVVNEMPEEAIKARGGMTELILRAKINAALQLKQNGADDLAKLIDDIDVSAMSTLDDFGSAALRAQSGGVADDATKSLIEEARKYKSAEEFVKAKTTRPDYGYGHSPNEDGVPAFDLTAKVDGEQMIPEDMYTQWYGSRGTPTDLESIAVLKKLKGNPEASVTIYRAGPKESWNYGDWTTLSKKYAQEHATGNAGFKVFSKEVQAKDLKWAMDDVNEFGYFPESTKSQLTDLWKQANKLLPEKGSVVYDEPALAGLALPLLNNKDKELDISSLKFPEPVSQEAVDAIFNPTGLENNKKPPEMYEPIKVMGEYKDDNGKVILLDDGVSLREVGRLKPAVKSVYETHPELPKGIIETILQQESSMGTNKKNYNPDIGEFAWLVGLTKVALKDLEDNGIDYDVDTKSGAIRAAGDYLALRQTEIPEKGGENKFYTDARELYFNRYAPQADKKKHWKNVGKYVSYYGQPRDKNVYYAQSDTKSK